MISAAGRLPKKVKKICYGILAFIGVITILALFNLSGLQTEYSLKQFLPANNNLLALDAKTKKTFQISEGQPFIVTLAVAEGEAHWLEASKIHLLAKTTNDLAKLPGVKSALSLATVQGAVDSKEGLSVGPLLESIPEKKWEQKVLENSLLAPALISKDLATVSILVTPEEIPHERLEALRGEIQQLAERNIAFAKIEVGGTPAVQTDIGVLLRNEIRNFVVLGFVACLLVLGIVFANLTPIIVALLVTLASNVIILATMAAFGYPFTVLSTTIPILATVTVMSLCIHTMLRFVEEEKLNPERYHYQTVFKTMRNVLGANFLASLTTTIGFLALLTTDVPLIYDFGVNVAFAVLICWAVSTVMMVPLLVLMPPPVARKWAWAKARWGLYLFRKSGAVAILIIVASIALAIKGQNLSWTAKLFDDLPSGHQAATSTHLIDEKLGGMIPIDLELHGNQEIWNDPRLLAQLNALIERFRNLPGVGSAVGLPDLLTAANITQHRLPASKASTAEIIFLYSLSDQSPLKNYLSPDTASTRIALRAQDIPSDELKTLVSSLKQEAETAFPGFKVSVTGMGSTIHQLNNELSRELIFGFWQSMMAIAFILVFVFRSLRWALVSCIPNLVPPAVLLGFLSLSETPIKPSIAIIFSIALGLAFVNTVYLLGRLRSMLKTSSLKVLDIEKMIWLEGNPCLISSLTLLAGFSVFMVSYFAMNRIFGFYMVLSMLAGLVGDLVLLPTLLKSCPWLLNPRSPAPFLKERTMSTISVLILTFAMLSTSRSVHAALPPASVDKVTSEISERLATKDEAFNVKMKIIEADKTSKEREMKITRLSPSKKEHYLLVRMQTPKDLKGTSLLATHKNGKDEKWLYLPSSKQTRRLAATSSESSSILGSELNTEDFNINTETTAKNKLQKEVTLNNQPHFVVESDVSAISSNYSRIVTFVEASSFLPTKSECYDKDGKLLKTITFSDYKKLANNKFRAGNIKIENVQNNRGTEIALSNIEVDQNMKSSAFTPKALSEE